jgi:Nitroreductase
MKNEIIQAIENRRSIRKYKDEAVPQNELEKLVELSLQAPSARNQQPWHLIVVRDQVLLQEISDAVLEVLTARGRNMPQGWHMFHHAPVVIMIPRDTANAWGKVDSGIASQTMALAAYGMQLGTCIIGLIHHLDSHERKEEFYRRLQVPEGHQLDVCLSVGYPDEAPDARPREKKVTWHE